MSDWPPQLGRSQRYAHAVYHQCTHSFGNGAHYAGCALQIVMELPESHPHGEGRSSPEGPVLHDSG